MSIEKPDVPIKVQTPKPDQPGQLEEVQIAEDWCELVDALYATKLACERANAIKKEE